MSVEVITQWWNEYAPVIIGIGGTIMTVGGIILVAYLKFKPILDAFKSKIDSIKDKVTDTSKEDVTNVLQSVDLQVKITDLEEKIANPLTSENAKEMYRIQLKILIQTQTKLDAGIAKTEEVTSKY